MYLTSEPGALTDTDLTQLSSDLFISRHDIRGDKVNQHQQGGWRREADQSHGRPPRGVRGSELQAGQTDRGAEGGDTDLPEVRGETQTYRESGVREECHPEVPDSERVRREGPATACPADHPQAEEGGGGSDRAVHQR